MKPACKRNKPRQVRIERAKLALALIVGLLCGCSAVAAQVTPAPAAQKTQKKKDELWHNEGLPPDAVFRYGSTERNPRAIGVYALRFSADGKLLVIRDKRQSIRVLDLEKRELVAVLPTQSVLDYVVTPDNKQVIVGNRKKVQVWSIAEAEIKREFEAEAYKLAMASEPDELVTVGKGVVNRYRWPLPSKPNVIRSKLSGATVLASGVSKDGKFAIFHNGSTCEVLDTVEGKPVLPAPKVVPKKALISPNSHLLAEMNYGDSRVKVFDLRNARKYQFSLKDKRRVVTAAFSNDSRFLYSSNYDNSIVIWDLVTMQSVARVAGHKSRIYALAADPSRLFCLTSGTSSSLDRSVLYWDFRNRLFPPIKDVDGAKEFALDDVWKELGSDDATDSLAATNRLYRALQNDPEVAEKTTARLGIDQVADDSRAAKYVKDLDDPKYDVREKATVMLKSMVERIRPMLERQLADCSQEAKWRIQRILRTDKLRPEVLTADGRRGHRIILALELCGNESAIDALKRIARHSKNQTMVDLAKDAIDRL